MERIDITFDKVETSILIDEAIQVARKEVSDIYYERTLFPKIIPERFTSITEISSYSLVPYYYAPTGLQI